MQGTVEARRVGETQWQPVRLNDAFHPGDTIRVQERSRADLALREQSVLRLNANTTMTVEAVAESHTWVVDLLRGAAYFLSSGPRRLNVRTAFATAGVRGTEFYVGVEANNAVFTILEGTVVAQNAAGTLTLTGGQSAVAEAGKAPGLRTIVRPRDAVQWALYYPPVLYFSPEELPPGTDWRGAVLRSIEWQRRGDLQKAFDAIAGVPDTVADPRFFAYRASLLLAVGRVDAARADIERALSLAPKDPNALALQVIIAVVQGENDKALASAQNAVQAAPTSATARIALSYARQARFDLDGARVSLQTAVFLDPKNALAWARLAELHSSLGERDESLEAAQKAVALEPNLSRTQTVLGYAYLTQLKTAPAKAAFEKALALDQADPLPRMGLGLAKVREGDLSGGTSDMEIASLDPNNALIRSYLGKAYFEQKREGLDEREFRVAKELDPKDPTPWFYDAIREQTANRPVEALQDLQKAIELNDNRAVYRSRLLLDSDLAARGASLGRIYSDLGFEELALTEGWKSVNVDPTNFSAHRLLADSYSVLPRHEIARVSELLQSQLLQPVHLAPIQPRLAESDLKLISAGGPGALSNNEFNQLFTSNGFSVQTSGLVGNRGTSGEELVVSGLKDNIAFSLGGFHFNTDGWRENAGQRDTIGNAFVQMDFSPGTGVQFEYRSRDIHTGDLNMSFFPDNVLNQLTTSGRTDTYRLGFRHSFSPDSIVLGSFVRQTDRNQSLDTTDPTFSVDTSEPNSRATGAELQYLYRSSRFNAVGGVGSYKLDRKQLTTVDVPGQFTTVTDDDGSIKHTNVYLYTYLNDVVKNVTITLGASKDFFKSDDPTTTTFTDIAGIFGGDSVSATPASLSKNQVNPKFGLTWNPVPDTTLRAATFRVLKRSLIANQTLEPTQVAGFNQFYDDIEATDSRQRYGVAADQKFSRTLFGGLAYSRRDLAVPLSFIDDSGVTQNETEKWRERLLRPYLFWTPHRWVALSAEYQYERFERTADSLNFGVQDATTTKVPLGLRFFHPSGLTLGVKLTHVKQVGEFLHLGNCCEAGESSFWLADLALSYRLPKRYGFLSVGATNLADRKFQYQETDFNNPTILPRRMVFVRLTLALP